MKIVLRKRVFLYITLILLTVLYGCGAGINKASNDEGSDYENNKNIRIAVASFAMETCTFCPRRTDIEHFEFYGAPLTGEEVLSYGRDVKGFVHATKEYQGIELNSGLAIFLLP